MAIRNKDLVTVKIHKAFFDNVFEPERKKLQNMTGVYISQVKFSNILSKSKINIKYPKRLRTFAPKFSKRGRPILPF